MTLEPLRIALRKLKPTGHQGFEGFVAEALTEITGHRFRLLKSGPQGGLDGVQDRNFDAPVVGFEAKHYGESSPLSLGTLKTKVEEASESTLDLDLWILATTRAIDAGDTGKLIQHGKHRGVDVLVLDWAGHVAVPPPLALICGMATSVFESWFSEFNDACQVVSDMRAGDLFNSLSTSLHRSLTSPSIGYGSAKEGVRKWNREQMASVASARSAFGSYANLEDQAAGVVVTRNPLNATLDDWWKSKEFAAVLTGQEGTGKTWTALAWWLSASEDATFPLTVIIPAQHVSETNGPAVVATALHRALRLHSSDFWARRLERWMGSSTEGVRLLVIVDGLDQNWRFSGWLDWMRSMKVSPWSDKVKVLFTCRPDHWHQQLRGLPSSEQSVVNIPMEGFDDDELDELLVRYNYKRTDFQSNLIKLLRVPRLCRIALKLKDHLKDSSDITHERLIFEDWCHRTSGAVEQISAEEFRAFIVRIGSDLKAESLTTPLSRKELLSRLTEDSGDGEEKLRGVLSEIIDGRWMEPTGKSHQFKLKEDMLPHVLALSLVTELRDVRDSNEAYERLVVRLEPYQSLDFVVSILRSAASISLFDSNCSPQVRGALMIRWLESQNFSSVDFEEFWRVLGCDVPTSLQVVEAMWFESKHHDADEVLIKALANAARWPNVQAGLEELFTECFRRYWLDPMEDEFTGSYGEGERAEARRTNTRSRARIWFEKVPANAFGWELKEVSGKGEPWGAARAAALMSFLPRASMIRPLTAWAVTHAILESARQLDALRWLLRWNRHDANEAESAILEAADRLLKTGNVVGTDAARVLLEALGSRAAMQRAAELPPRSNRLEQWRNVETVSLGDDNIVQWDFTAAREWPRCRTAPLDATMGLGEYAINPDTYLPDEGQEALRSIAGEVTDSMLRGEEGGSRHDDGGLDTAHLALSRWAPVLRGELERRQWVAPKADEVSAWKNERGIPCIAPRFLVMNDAEVSAWRSVLDAQLEAALESGESSGVDLDLHGAFLAGLSAREQIELIRCLPGPPIVLERYENLLAAPSPEDFDLLQEVISAADQKSTRGWLKYLTCVNLAHMPKGWLTVATLLGNEDESIRSLAMEIAWRAKDVILADTLAASAWCYDTAKSDTEKAYGSSLLALASCLSPQELRRRIHPEVFGWIIEKSGADRECIDYFADHVKSALARLSKRQFDRSLFNQAPGWDVLAADRPEELKSWVTPFLTQNDAHSMALFHRFPLRDAIDALGKIDPDLAAKIVEQQIEGQRGASMRIEDVWITGMCVPGAAGDRAREAVLDAANNDDRLSDVVHWAYRNGSEDWLYRVIHRDLGDASSGIVARAMTLAGFLNVDEQSLALWERIKGTSVPGWLEHVQSIAYKRFVRHQWAMHWYDRYMAGSDEEAFAAHELLVAAMDARIYRQLRMPQPKVFYSWPWRKQLHWLACSGVRRAAIEAVDKNLKDVLFGQRLPHPMQSPRLQ